MKKIYIINNYYLDTKTLNPSIGGVQTYITNLINVISSMNYQTVVIQMSNEKFEKRIGDVIVYGINSQKREFAKRAVDLIKDDGIIVFANDEFIVKSCHNKTISIQHGIGWDKPELIGKGKIKNSLYFFNVILNSMKILSRVKKVDKLVCVDYNFVNWYRTQVSHTAIDMSVIPNFADTVKEINKEKSNVVRIIFARRLFWYRGTRLFANVAKRLMELYNNIEITFAGDGPDEKYLHDCFNGSHQVKFIKYTAAESLAIHKDKDIAVIPTVGSEGTSLSLLEAMASKCAVVCTNVGGMTNIIIDRYNGLMVNPDEDELFEAVTKVVANDILRENLAQKAYETVNEGFSFDIWKEKWISVIEKVSGDKT